MLQCAGIPLNRKKEIAMVTIKEIERPEIETDLFPVMLSDETMLKRKEAILKK